MFEFVSVPCMLKRAFLHLSWQMLTSIYFHIFGIIACVAIIACKDDAPHANGQLTNQEILSCVLTIQVLLHASIVAYLINNTKKKDINKRPRRRVAIRARG